MEENKMKTIEHKGLSSICPECEMGHPVDNTIIDPDYDFVLYKYDCSNPKCDHSGDSGMMRFEWGYGSAILKWNGEKNYTQQDMLDVYWTHFNNRVSAIEKLLTSIKENNKEK